MLIQVDLIAPGEVEPYQRRVQTGKTEAQALKALALLGTLRQKRRRASLLL